MVKLCSGGHANNQTDETEIDYHRDWMKAFQANDIDDAEDADDDADDGDDTDNLAMMKRKAMTLTLIFLTILVIVSTNSAYS